MSTYASGCHPYISQPYRYHVHKHARNHSLTLTLMHTLSNNPLLVVICLLFKLSSRICCDRLLTIVTFDVDCVIIINDHDYLQSLTLSCLQYSTGGGGEDELNTLHYVWIFKEAVSLCSVNYSRATQVVQQSHMASDL